MGYEVWGMRYGVLNFDLANNKFNISVFISKIIECR